MTILSTFHGIGCMNLALDRAGLKPEKVFTSEIDPAANLVNKVRFPDNVPLGDISAIKSDNLPDLDLLVGGSPCQGLSRMGGRLNFKDPRSKLFYEFLRILDDKKPKYFLLENVRMDAEVEKLITKYLGVKPFRINSALVSAQNRHRLYWTNLPGAGIPEDKGIELKDILLPDLTNPANIPTGLKLRKKSKCVRVGGRSSPVFSKHEWDYPYEKDKSKFPFLDLEEIKKVRRFNVTECSRLQTVPDNFLSIPGITQTAAYKMLGNCWTVDVITHQLKGLK